jgi:hypothetical protein
MTKKILFLTLISLFFLSNACAQKKTPAASTNKPATETKTETKTVEAKLFGANLIKNGGAETGNSSPWKSEDELKTFEYNGGWGDAWQVMPPDKGDKFFFVSIMSTKPTLSFAQEFDVSEIAKNIDAGLVGYNLGGWFGVRGDAAGRMKVEFYDANKALISRPKDTDATEKITSANKPDDVTMVEKTRGGDVPAGTRRIKVALEFSIFEDRDRSKESEGESPRADSLSFVLTSKQ